VAGQEISDDVWAVIEPLLARVSGRSRPRLPYRQVVEGMLWRFRTGAPWRDVPERFGTWNTRYGARESALSPRHQFTGCRESRDGSDTVL
jgi:transposase